MSPAQWLDIPPPLFSSFPPLTSFPLLFFALLLSHPPSPPPPPSLAAIKRQIYDGWSFAALWGKCGRGRKESARVRDRKTEEIKRRGKRGKMRNENRSWVSGINGLWVRCGGRWKIYRENGGGKIGMREDKGKRFLLSFGQAITPCDMLSLSLETKDWFTIALCVSVRKNYSSRIRPFSQKFVWRRVAAGKQAHLSS